MINFMIFMLKVVCVCDGIFQFNIKITVFIDFAPESRSNLENTAVCIDFGTNANKKLRKHTENTCFCAKTLENHKGKHVFLRKKV